MYKLQLFVLFLNLHVVSLAQYTKGAKVLNNDSTINIVARNTSIDIYEMITREKVGSITTSNWTSIASISDDDTKIIAPSPDQINIYDLESQDLIRSIDLKSFKATTANTDRFKEERKAYYYNKFIQDGLKEKQALKLAEQEVFEEYKKVKGQLDANVTVGNSMYNFNVSYSFAEDTKYLIRQISVVYLPSQDEVKGLKISSITEVYDTEDFKLLKTIVINESLPDYFISGNQLQVVRVLQNGTVLYGASKLSLFSLKEGKILQTIDRLKMTKQVLGEEQYNSLIEKGWKHNTTWSNYLIMAKQKGVNESEAKRTIEESQMMQALLLTSQSDDAFVFQMNEGSITGTVEKYVQQLYLYNPATLNSYGPYENATNITISKDWKYASVSRYSEYLANLSVVDPEYSKAALNVKEYSFVDLYDLTTGELIQTFNGTRGGVFRENCYVIFRKQNGLENVQFNLTTRKKEKFTLDYVPSISTGAKNISKNSNQKLKFLIKDDNHSFDAYGYSNAFAVSKSGRYIVFSETVKKSPLSPTADAVLYNVVDLQQLKSILKIPAIDSNTIAKHEIVFNEAESKIGLVESFHFKKKETHIRVCDLASGKVLWHQKLDDPLTHMGFDKNKMKSVLTFGNNDKDLVLLLPHKNMEGSFGEMDHNLYKFDALSGNSIVKELSSYFPKVLPPKSMLKIKNLRNDCEIPKGNAEELYKAGTSSFAVEAVGDKYVIYRETTCYRQLPSVKEAKSGIIDVNKLVSGIRFANLVVDSNLELVESKNNQNQQLKTTYPAYMMQVASIEDTVFAHSDNYKIHFVIKPNDITDIKIVPKNASFEVYSFQISDKISFLKLTEKGDRLIARIKGTNELRIYDLKSQSVVARIVSRKNNLLFITPDNYYKSDKNVSDVISFSKGLDSYSFGQFDAKYNRPDIVLDRLGFASKDLIELYQKAYVKRLKSLGINEEAMNSNISAPAVSVSKLTDPSKDGKVKLKIGATSEDEELLQLQVIVNGVPIFGKKGVPATGYSFEKEISVQLENGKNDIEVYAINKLGFRSEWQRLIVNHYSDTKPSLYLYSIGVSEFKDAHYNLTYASKDAVGISTLFKSKSDAFENVYSHTYTNKQVNNEMLAEIKTQIAKAKVDDYVIIFIASHGLLDAEYNYYIAGHNTDFTDPSNGGILYENIEGLFNATPARNRLIMLDACHAGEVDKEEEITQEEAMIVDEGIVFRGVGNAKKTVGLENSFQLMQSLFQDTREGTGSIVIAAAGGYEFAFESEKWSHGVFTYSLLNGIESGAADLNKDENITIKELYQYVSGSVQSLTGGNQVPTTRGDNAYRDFIIWR